VNYPVKAIHMIVPVAPGGGIVGLYMDK